MSMGIYIKGMDMPKNCLVCRCTDSEYGECVLDPEKRCPENYGKIADWCPLVPVPDHGRLGNLDAFESIKYELPEGQKAFNRGFHSGVQYVQRLIMDAPTIIPADEG